MNKKQIKIACVDGVNDGDIRWFESLVGDKFEFIKDEKKPQFVFYSIFGTRHIHYDCVRVFMTGENCRADFNFCDYAITFDYLDFEDRHCRYPLYLRVLGNSNKDDKIYKKANFTSQMARRKFCSFVVSNGKANELRSEIFDKLCAYKRVDSAGKYKNNMGFCADDKISFLRNYKFNICFENSNTKGYITEKIIDAKRADTIPIYWGGA